VKWIGQHIVDSIAKFRNTVDFSEDVTFYQPVNDANPSIRIGSSDDECFQLSINYQGTTTQSAQIIQFGSRTESGTANDGRFNFSVDQTSILKIQDGGIDLYAGKGIGINGVDILTDNGSGVATLSNIDDLDATTIATFNSHLTAGDITSVVAGSGLTDGGTSGEVTLNAIGGDGITANANDLAITAGQTTITSIYNNALKVGVAANSFIDFATGSNILFNIENTSVLAIKSGVIAPVQDNSMDLGTSDLEFKDAYFDGVVTSDSFVGRLTGQASTVETIAGLAPDTATTQATQGAITSAANLATVGTIGTGVWEGTAIATDQQKHLMHYQVQGYATGGTGGDYVVSKNIASNTAPFLHNVSTGSDGTNSKAVTVWMRTGGHVMPNACTLTRFTGWTESQGSASQTVALFRVRLSDDSDTDPSAVLLQEVTYTASGNQIADLFNVTSSSGGQSLDLAAGDIVFSAIKGAGNPIYFNGTFEVEF